MKGGVGVVWGPLPGKLMGLNVTGGVGVAWGPVPGKLIGLKVVPGGCVGEKGGLWGKGYEGCVGE